MQRQYCEAAARLSAQPYYQHLLPILTTSHLEPPLSSDPSSPELPFEFLAISHAAGNSTSL